MCVCVCVTVHLCVCVKVPTLNSNYVHLWTIYFMLASPIIEPTLSCCNCLTIYHNIIMYVCVCVACFIYFYFFIITNVFYIPKFELVSVLGRRHSPVAVVARRQTRCLVN